MTKPRFARRKVLIDRKLQLGLSMTIILLLACYFLVFCAIAVFAPHLVSLASSSSEEQVKAATRHVGESFNLLIFPMAMTFVCLALHCILLTHKVAGPAYRFRKTLETIRGRDLSVEIRLRRGDYMQNLAEEFNAATATLREDLGEALRVAETVAEAARSQVSRTTGPAADQAGDLATRAERVTALLAAYRLRDENQPD